MILPHVSDLAKRRIILASGSPRRKELLTNLGLKFEVLVSSFDEKLPHDRFKVAAEYAVETARHKALDVAAVVSRAGGPPADLIISSDTIVEHGGKILEKPADAEDAFRTIKSLSGQRHQVHTGVVLLTPPLPASGASEPHVRSFYCTTHVKFAELTDDLIQAYIATGEPFDKAGSYGIQGLAGSFVEGIEGCYFNVMGFPVHRFTRELVALIKEGYIPLSSMPLK